MANAIVIQAVDDYIEAIIDKTRAENILIRANSTISECETFFKSEWYEQLTSIDPQKVMDVAVIQARYLMWQKSRGCHKCKHTSDECPHRIRKANWQAWNEGDRNCLKTKKNRSDKNV